MTHHFFWGVAIGAAAGILFAPMTGVKTRAMIGEKAQKGQDLLKQKGCEAYSTTMDSIERGKAAFQQTTNSIADALEAGKQTIRG